MPRLLCVLGLAMAISPTLRAIETHKVRPGLWPIKSPRFLETLAPDYIRWNDYNEGMKQSRERKAPTLLFFGDPRHEFTIFQKRTIHKNSRLVRQLAENVIPIFVDMSDEKNRMLVHNLNVDAIPYFVLGDHEGRIIGSFSGQQSAENILKWFEKVTQKR